MTPEEPLHKRSRTVGRTALAVLGSAALLLSVLLSLHQLAGGHMPGCSGGTSCDEVLQSRWSMLAGILPVSSLAVGVYLAFLLTLYFTQAASEEPIRLLAWKILTLLSGVVVGSAVWFVLVQLILIKAFCPYCMSAHVVGTVLSVTALILSFKMLQKKMFVRCFLSGLAFSALLAVSQQTLAATPRVSGQATEELIVPDFSRAPVIGSAEASIKVLLLFDYNCSHCQKIHFQLQEAVRRYNGKLAVYLCPTPLNTGCNPYVPKDNDMFRSSCELARIGLAVWQFDPTRFAEFETWMFSYETGDRWLPRSAALVRNKVAEWMNPQALDSLMNDAATNQYLQTSVELFGRTMQSGRGGIPRLVYGSRWVIPETNNPDELLSVLQEELNVPKP